MNEISCDMCMDLIPLVKDGIASEDSQKAVALHIQTCENCRNLYDGETPPMVNGDVVFKKIKNQTRIFGAMVMMFGIFFGLSLMNGQDMFYNTVIMPCIGAIGYGIFSWKAMYVVPILLLVTNSVTNFLRLIPNAEILDLYSLFMWTFLYSIFVWLGVVIAGLLHFAFRKER